MGKVAYKSHCPYPNVREDNIYSWLSFIKELKTLKTFNVTPNYMHIELTSIITLFSKPWRGVVICKNVHILLLAIQTNSALLVFTAIQG